MLDVIIPECTRLIAQGKQIEKAYSRHEMNALYIVYHVNMAKRTELQKLKDRTWELCKQITRKRYIRSDGTFTCYTCDRVIDSPEKAHTGHFLPSGACGAYLRHSLRNLRVQDYYCNINLGGNGTEFYKRMTEEVGEEEVAQLFRDKQKIIKADKHFYQALIDEYEKL